MTQAYEELFDDEASNGTPRTKLNERFQKKAPDLYAKIMDARAKGEKYSDGIFEYGLTESDQYGITVYKNKARRSTVTASGKQSYFQSEEFKQAQTQKSNDIKKAQLERRNQHRELIVAMTNLRKAIVEDIADRRNMDPDQVSEAMGFDQYREEQETDFALDHAD